MLEENALHRAMPPGVGDVLKGKNLLEWKAILEELNYPDMPVLEEVLRGS